MAIDRSGLRQWRILFLHFFEVFFYGETDDHDDSGWGQLCLVLLAIASCDLYTAWSLFSGLAEIFSLDNLWGSFVSLLALQMIMSGIFLFISWPNIFLNSRDHGNLAHLPVPVSTIVTAKIAVVLLVVILLSLVHVVSVMPVILGFSLGKIDVSAFLYGWAISTHFLWGNVWIFFTLASLLGACQYLTRWRFGSWLFHFFYIGGISLFMGILFYFPRMTTLAMAKNETADIAGFLPLKIPFLFLEKIKAALHMPGAAMASGGSHFLEFSSIGSVIFTLLLFQAFFRRFQASSRKLPPAGSQQAFAFFNSGGWRWIGRLVQAGPERGLFFFMKKTFFKNKFLWIFLILLWTPLFGLLVAQTISAEGTGYLGVFSGNQSEGILVGVILGFLLVFFLRMIFKQAINLEADWIWQVPPSISLTAVFRATMKVVFFVFCPLLWLFLIFIYTRYWPLAPALFFCLGFWPMFIAITFTLFFTYDSNIPFTGFRHQEGEPHSINAWPFYLLIAAVYILAARWLALRLIHAPVFLFSFQLGAVLIIRKFCKKWERITFYSGETSAFE